MHDTTRATALFGASTQLREHRLGGITAVDDDRQIELQGQIKLGAQHCQLLGQILLSEQIQPEFADRHHASVGGSGGGKHHSGVGLPVLGVERMDAHRIAQLRQTIGQGADPGDLGGLHAGMHQGPYPGLAPALAYLLQIRIEVAEDQMAMAVDQDRRIAAGRGVDWS